MCPWTSRWWKRFCSTPRSASSSGSTTARRAELAHQLEPPRRPRRGDDPAQLAEHALGRDAGQRAGLLARAAQRLARPPRGPSSTASRTSRSTRSGSSANAPGPAIRRRPRRQIGRAPERVDRRPAGERLGDRVDGEVAQRQVGLQRAAAQRLDVDLPGARRVARPARRRTPRRARSTPPAPRPRGDRARRRGRVAVDDDVEVERSRARARGRGPRRPPATPRSPASAARAAVQAVAHPLVASAHRMLVARSRSSSIAAPSRW